jgi:drug/metabolite transporter (DMT)-like permease
VIGVGLALGAGLLWGGVDFLGGVASRRAAFLTVTFVAQAVGMIGLLLWLPFAGGISGESFGYGLLAGIGVASGLSLLYWALSIGTMSIVAPITACSVLIPFSLAIGGGERPSTVAVTGALLAAVGVIVASLEERRTGESARMKAVLLALGAAVGIGTFVFLLGKGGQAGSTFSTLFGARITAMALLIVALALTRTGLRQPMAALGLAALMGVGDVVGNALFVLAADRGLLSIVSVLASIYPIVTVILAHLVLGERITRTQRAGVVFAMTGVAAVSLG